MLVNRIIVDWEIILLILQAVFLFLLVLGVPLSKGGGNKKPSSDTDI